MANQGHVWPKTGYRVIALGRNIRKEESPSTLEVARGVAVRLAKEIWRAKRVIVVVAIFSPTGLEDRLAPNEFELMNDRPTFDSDKSMATFCRLAKGFKPPRPSKKKKKAA